MDTDDNVVQFPGPEFLLQCDCGSTEFRIIINDEAPFKVKDLECSCGKWSAPVADVLKACEQAEHDQ